MATPSQRGKSNRRKGAQAERDVVTWLRANGWPGAERAIATGNRSGDRVRLDPGDISGTPGLVWQVKDTATFDQPAQRTAALAETEAQRVAAGAEIGLLVRRKRGTTNVAQWEAWLSAHVLSRLLLKLPIHDLDRRGYPVCLPLGIVAYELRRSGYGTPIDTEEQSA